MKFFDFSGYIKFKGLLQAAVPLVIGFFLYLVWPSETRKRDEIVVSIKPIHSLICALTKGITKPALLLDGYISPHHAQLTPSQVQSIQNAKLVVWIGPAYEQPLYKHVKTLKNKVLTIQESSLVKLRPLRNGTFWDKKTCCNHEHCDSDHCDVSNHDHHQANSVVLDGHIWLDPLMMVKVVDIVLQYLKKLYPNHQELLCRNATTYKNKLESLHQHLLKVMEPYKGKTYIIQHDGNQYFDKVYGVQTVATISIDPGVPPNAGHMLKIRKAINNDEIQPRCLFAERQMDGALAKSYAKTLKISFGIVDYLGADISAGEDAYEALMKTYVNAFIEGIK